MNIGSSGKRYPGAVSSLGSIMLGSGNGYVWVEGSSCAVRVGNQAVSSKNLRLDAGSSLEFQEDALELIISDMIRLGEREIYGINGGMIVINFGDDERHLTPGEMSADTSGVRRLGKLPICTDNIATYELHLTLIPSTNIKHKMANLFRRFQAKPPVLVVDQKFKLDKKKLYQF